VCCFSREYYCANLTHKAKCSHYDKILIEFVTVDLTSLL
jgi:hypothetical protein